MINFCDKKSRLSQAEILRTKGEMLSMTSDFCIPLLEHQSQTYFLPMYPELSIQLIVLVVKEARKLTGIGEVAKIREYEQQNCYLDSNQNC
jgi:hypothetical protein